VPGKILEFGGLEDVSVNVLQVVAVYGQCLLILNESHLKHGVLAATATACVLIIVASTTKAQAADIITHGQYQYVLDGHILCVLLAYFRVKV
jgi:hypothetical protein